MKNIIIKIDNGEVSYKKTESASADRKFVESVSQNKHLCGDCDNCSPAKCLKIFDEVKRVINDYEFVTHGYQIYDKNGIMEKLYISKCKDFIPSKVRRGAKTGEELRKLKRMKDNLKIMYFDAENIEEANQTQYDLLNRGQIYFGNFDAKERRK